MSVLKDSLGRGYTREKRNGGLTADKGDGGMKERMRVRRWDGKLWNGMRKRLTETGMYVAEG